MQLWKSNSKLLTLRDFFKLNYFHIEAEENEIVLIRVGNEWNILKICN